jgi:hypothetical protein
MNGKMLGKSMNYHLINFCASSDLANDGNFYHSYVCQFQEVLRKPEIFKEFYELPVLKS